MVRVYLILMLATLISEAARGTNRPEVSRECGGVKIECSKAIDTVENFTRFMKGDMSQDPYEQCETFERMNVEVPSCCLIQNNCGY